MSRTNHARPAHVPADTMRIPRSAAMARRARRTATRQAYIAARLAERI